MGTFIEMLTCLVNKIRVFAKIDISMVVLVFGVMSSNVSKTVKLVTVKSLYVSARIGQLTA